VTAAVADEAQRRIEGPTPIVRLRFGENLERVRRERGCSFDTLAAGSRIERRRVEEMVRGERKVRAEDLVLLARALGVSVEDLTAGINWITTAEGGPRWDITVGGSG
jgi:transcriptional regulator with XRE-family HTH domain